MITFCATEEWICQFGCARAPFVQRRLTAEASSQLHALGDRVHEDGWLARACHISARRYFGRRWSPCYASCSTCVACFAVKFLLKRQSAGHVCSRQPGDTPACSTFHPTLPSGTLFVQCAISFSFFPRSSRPPCLGDSAAFGLNERHAALTRCALRRADASIHSPLLLLHDVHCVLPGAALGLQIHRQSHQRARLDTFSSFPRTDPIRGVV